MTASPKPLQIEFVSDVVCPWCVVGLGGLEAALGALAAEGITAEIHFQPFELNPDMAPEGENITEHIGRKYGATPDQSAKNRAMIRDRAAEAWPDDGKGFEMRMGPDSRIWNTFDAHRLLHWAGTIGLAEQRALKEALFRAHFTDNRPLPDANVLADAAEVAGLVPGSSPRMTRAEAKAVLADGLHAAEVRDAEALWRARGITGVPAVVVEGKYLISGGQPAAVFEEALRKIAGDVT